MASERPIDPLEAHASSWAISAGGSRAPTKGSFPVAGRPLFLGLTLIDFFIFRLYLNCEPIGSCYFPLGSNPNHPPRLRIKITRKGRLFLSSWDLPKSRRPQIEEAGPIAQPVCRSRTR